MPSIQELHNVGIINPFTYIASPSGGPLANGYIYIGTSSTDPTETVNRLAVRVVDDAGGFSPIDQPLRTNQYGLIVTQMVPLLALTSMRTNTQ